MKANEAPKRIWINSPQDLPCGFVDRNSVEYVRTDAFIEKAISWLKEQDEMIGVSFQEDFLERFKDYMKVEPQVKESAEIQHDKETCKENGDSLTLDGVITFDYYEGDKAYGCVAHDSFCLEDLGLKDRDEVKILIFKK